MESKKRFSASEITYTQGYTSGRNNADSLLTEAVKAAKSADVVLFFGGLNKNKNQDSEGSDRKDFRSPIIRIN